MIIFIIIFLAILFQKNVKFSKIIFDCLVDIQQHINVLSYGDKKVLIWFELYILNLVRLSTLKIHHACRYLWDIL